MTDAEAYNRCHCLLRSAKAAGWKISLTPGGAWRVSHRSGGGVTVAPRLSARGLLEVERQIASIERQHPSTPAGRAPRTEELKP